MGHIRLGTHLFLFTFTLYLCKHEAAMQTQTWASEKSGQFQESRIGMIHFCRWHFLLLPPHPTPTWIVLPPLLGLQVPANLQDLLKSVFLGKCGPTSLALWLPCSSPATRKSVHHLIISSAALLLYYWNLCYISPTKTQIL